MIKLVNGRGIGFCYPAYQVQESSSPHHSLMT